MVNKAVLDGTHFNQLFHKKFSQIVLPLHTLGVTSQHLDTDQGLYLSMVTVISYYLGYMDRNSSMSQQKMSYIDKISKELMSSRLRSMLYDTETINYRDWTARQKCLNILKMV